MTSEIPPKIVEKFLQFLGLAISVNISINYCRIIAQISWAESYGKNVVARNFELVHL